MPLFLFIFHIFFFYNIHTIIQSHSYNSFAESSLHLLIACKLSGTELPVVPSRESNSGLPSSKPTRYQRLCHAAPCQLCHAAPSNCATPHHNFPHSHISTFMCLWANYIFPRWVCLFCWRKYVDWSWEYVNRSKTHEWGNWGWGLAIPRKGIYKRNCRCSA